MDDEFYVDESPAGEISGTWGGEPPAGGGVWGGGSDSGGIGGGTPPGGQSLPGDWGTDNRGLFHPQVAAAALNLTSSGCFLADADGRIVRCRQRCIVVPALAAYLSGEECEPHWRCVLLRTSDPGRPVRTARVPGVSDASRAPLLMGYWPLGGPGSYRVYAKWQRGHYDYAKIRSVKFFVYGVSTGWVTLPLGGWSRIASIVVDEKYGIMVNGQPGRLTGNRTILE